VKTFLIATGGIRAGKIVPLEMAVDGLLELVEEQAGAEALRGLWVFPTMPRPIARPQRRDVVIEVSGVRASLTATSENVAAGIPTAGQLDLADDIAFLREIHEARRAEQAEFEDERAFQSWNIRWENLQPRLLEREKRKLFKKQLERVRRQVNPADADGVLAMAVGLAMECLELRLEIEDLKPRKGSRDC
jgi:hypothetical protein